MYCMYVSIQHCFELRNYSAVMAIVVTGLGSPSVRRLKLSWEVSKSECLHTYVCVNCELCVCRCGWVWACPGLGGYGVYAWVDVSFYVCMCKFSTHEFRLAK